MISEGKITALNGFFDRLEEGDLEGMMAVVSEVADPEVVFVSGLDTQIDGREYVGHAGLREYFSELIATVRVTYRDRAFEAVDADHLLFLCDLEMVGRSSGARMRQPIGQIYEYEGGMIRRVWSYTSPADARAHVTELVRA